MRRRTFLSLPGALGAKAVAAAPMPMVTLPKSRLRVSRFCLGGYHMASHGIDNGVLMVNRAIELGVNFFDSAWHYNDGRSDETYGKALAPARRKQIILMSKAHFRTEPEATRQLEDTLRRMNTDYLDLWQCHQVSTMQEVDQILGPKGALEAFVKAKRQGKVRHIGFTGHHDPAVHLRLLDAFDGWETVQFPVNLIDPHYLSFINTVLPKVRAKGLAVLAMKSNGMGAIGQNNIASIEECLRFSLSQDINALVSGPETVPQLEQNVGIVKTARKMSREEMDALLARTAKGPHGSKIEGYKKPEGKTARRIHIDGEPLAG